MFQNILCRFAAASRKPAQPRHQPLRFEQLENRDLMAGNVVASFDLAHNTLNITGDAAANSVQVVEYANSMFETFDVRGSLGTTINGKSSESFYFRANTETKVNVNLGEGDDRFNFYGQGHHVDYLFVSMGGGNNSVAITDASFEKLKIFGGTQSDDIRLTLVNAGNAVIDARDGTNLSKPATGADSVAAYYSDFGVLSINTGLGNDNVNLDHVSAQYLLVDLNDGNDSLKLGHTSAQDSALYGGAGFDTLDETAGGNSLSAPGVPTHTISGFEFRKRSTLNQSSLSLFRS